MRKLLVCFAVLGCVASQSSHLFAQGITVPPDTPFKIEFKNFIALGTEVWNYHWKCDDVVIKNYTAAELLAGKSATADVTGLFTYTLSVPGLAAGPHTCAVTVDNGPLGGESTSELVSVPAGTAPPIAPVQLRILVTPGVTLAITKSTAVIKYK